MLVFNSYGSLFAIFKSAHSTHKLTNNSMQAISSACLGKAVSSCGFYFRHLSPNIELEWSDIGTLRVQDYDQMCGNTDRKYHTVKQMLRQKVRNQLKQVTNEDSDY